MHDIRNQKTPNNISNLFINSNSIQSYNTRSSASNKFYIKHSYQWGFLKKKTIHWKQNTGKSKRRFNRSSVILKFNDEGKK